MAKKIDSNITGLAYAEESSLNVLPGTPDWYQICPNSYNDFGGTLENIARSCIEPSRQKKKGTPVDLDASGGFNIDFTQNNLLRLMQGFFFADAREKAATQPLVGTQVAITSVTGTGEIYNAASGLDVFKAGDLIKGIGFAGAGNNGLKLVTASSGTTVTVAEDLADEASPDAKARLVTVGYEFDADEISIASAVNGVTLTATTTDLTTLGLNVGETVFLGGDVATSRFDNNVGYGRIRSISATEIVFDDTTWAPQTESGSGKTIRMFFGTVIRNEKDSALIKRRTYQLERTLGEDDDGTMSEYLVGAVPNEFSFNIAQADKLNSDLSFVAMNNEQYTGLEGVKTGNRIQALNEAAYNTSSNIYRIKMGLQDVDAINQDALFAYVTEANLGIANGVEPAKAVGVLGAFDANLGDFEVSGSITAYFSTIEAVKAVRNNEDVGLNIIASSNNEGIAFDIPLLSLGDGKINIEKDQPVTIPLDTTAAEGTNGYTMLYTNFAYLPDVAMPNQ